MLMLVYGWRKLKTNGVGHGGDREGSGVLPSPYAASPRPLASPHLSLYACMFHSNYSVCRNLMGVYTLCWVALPRLNSCYNEFGMIFGIIATIVTLLRAAAHHLLPPGAAHLLMLIVAGIFPALSIFGMLVFLRSFTFSWRLSTEGHTTLPGLWAVCQYNSSPEVHLVAWQTMSFWLPVQEFLLGLTMAATFHAHPFIVACDVVLQAGIILLVFFSSRLVLDEHISPVAFVTLVGMSLHVAGWLLSLRLNEPTVAAWRAHKRSKIKSGAAPLEVATGRASGHAPKPGGGGGGGSSGVADHGTSRRVKRPGTTVHVPTVDGWLEERDWRARASTCTEAYVQVLHDARGEAIVQACLLGLAFAHESASMPLPGAARWWRQGGGAR